MSSGRLTRTEERAILKRFGFPRPPTKTEALQRFIRKLLVAHAASEAVDYFDLREDKESIEQFHKLEVEQYKTGAALIRFAQRHGDIAIAGLRPEKRRQERKTKR
jgi:hypothetical protein